MRLPHADAAIVEQAKICGYLLDPEHPFGASKARFFTAFGFTLDAWEELAIALRRYAAENDVVKVKETDFGPRYEIDGELTAVDGRRPVWQQDEGQDVPRLITAHPLEANHDT
jgi:hypothetical protein